MKNKKIKSGDSAPATLPTLAVVVQETPTQTVPTVSELRKKGFQIKVLHLRYLNVPVTNPVAGINTTVQELCVARKEKEFHVEVVDGHTFLVGPQCLADPRGGATIVAINGKNGCSFSTQAVCSKADNYSKKEGVKTAIQRLLNNLPV